MKKSDTPDFDPSGPAANDGIFGLPYAEKQAKLVYVPVPWEATTSYGGGTSDGPSAILEASRQIDLYDGEVEKPYTAGLFMRGESGELRKWNVQAKRDAAKVIAALEKGKDAPKPSLKLVNALSEKVNAWVYGQTRGILKEKKIPALVGGDHAAPWGAIKAAAEAFPGLGVLHFDAHHDLRVAYEGFVWSHASIFYNVLEKLPVKKLVQVGIRDFSQEERAYVRGQGKRCAVFYDSDLAKRRFAGRPFSRTARDIAAELPKNVWVSFDIDGLDQRFCPSTGTPVPGGLDFAEAVHIIETIVRSGRRIVGFDLCEVSPGKDSEWDANVGARLLYKLSAWALASQRLARILPSRHK